MVTSSASPQVTVGLPEGHVVMVIAQCWLPDLELKVAGEQGGGTVAVGSKNSFFTLGKGHHATQGLAILTPQAIEPRSQGSEATKGDGYRMPRKRRGWDCGF